MEPFPASQSHQNPIFILPINKVQGYAWGCKDKNSFVGQMTDQTLQNYAEFWMGTHPNGESKISQEISLKQYLLSNNIKQIEFLFKILSIEKCLSIQAHPNEQQAKQLNHLFPQIYVDSKDKPEMFLTLSEEFELFLGFIDEKEFQYLNKIQPFHTLTSTIGEVQHNEKLMVLLEKLVHLSEADLKNHIEKLLQNLGHFEEKRQNLLKRIFSEFNLDTGILVSCILQYHILEKGSCFGIEAGIPHAYIKGECFELMKNSDNVVRLGLTPKQKDIPNLLKIIKNNIHRTYCKVQKRQNNLMEKYEWNSYSIMRIKLSSKPNKIQIDFSSIGILMDGQALITSAESGQSLTRIISKTVCFIIKGLYNFQGQGEIVIASKA